VYELKNFSHLHQMLVAQNQVRETWFYPESAYWVTFDNSIPLLLLPYLNARYKDIETCAALGIPGHVTFSSGWEWGYWLVDWSIARWSWTYEMKVDGAPTIGPMAGPYQYLQAFFPQAEASASIATIADMQQRWLIEGNLLRWLCPSNPTDELPKPMNKQFQPRGFVNLGDLGKAARKTPKRLATLPLDSLEAYASQTLAQLVLLQAGWPGASGLVQKPGPLASELIDALHVTALRARHSAQLMGVVQLWQRTGYSRTVLKSQMALVALHRERTLAIVRVCEARYRYPLAQLATRYKSHTAYDFGYLYTVHDLHFWEREEQQILKGRHGPFFRNIYELGKIAGLRN
jgi:hypothetical protein